MMFWQVIIIFIIIGICLVNLFALCTMENEFFLTSLWENIGDMPINIVGKTILITLTTILFLPAIVVIIIASFVFIVIWCVCKFFLIIFAINPEKQMLREARREIKKTQKKGENSYEYFSIDRK